MTAETDRPVRVASVPAGHVYVRHALLSPDRRGRRAVRVLEDPQPPGARRPPGVWWPPLMLSPQWVRDNRHRFDVMHVHFGFESCTPDQLAAVVEELDRAGKPLVVTVHDLCNPHEQDPGPHRERLAVLLAGAASVLTLTPGAARELTSGWPLPAGAPVQVVPHPHVVGLGTMASTPPRPARPAGSAPVVGLHLRALRPSIDPTGWLVELARACADLGAQLLVHVNDEVPPHAPVLTAVLDGLRRAGHGRLMTVPRMDDAQLWQYVRGLDVAVLPYRHGTHSGWLEACWDLGTPVLGPALGHWAEQHPDSPRVAVFDPGRPRSLEVPLAALLAEGPGPLPWLERARQRREVSAWHAAEYRRLRRPVHRA